ncbi:MAG: hypothetical protein AAGG79_03960, partial [Pseudomonadota bacterium]
ASVLVIVSTIKIPPYRISIPFSSAHNDHAIGGNSVQRGSRMPAALERITNIAKVGRITLY